MRTLLGATVLICVSIVHTSNASPEGDNSKESSAKPIDLKSIKITPVSKPVELGEGPYWCQESQRLYFVDILVGNIHKLDPKSGKLSTYSPCNGTASFIIGVENTIDKFIVGCGTNVTLVEMDHDLDKLKPHMQTLTRVELDRTDTRFNDAKVDPVGRFWGGTMAHKVNGIVADNRGSLYSIDSSLVAENKLTPVSISNGLAWSSDNRVMYYIDSATKKVESFDYDPDKGSIKNRQTVLDFQKHNLTGIPDGMTIDTNDNLWVGQHEGGAILHIDPREKKILNTIPIPSVLVTSVAFGDAEFDTLYVTSARLENTQEASKEPHGGAIFTITGLGVRGLPSKKFKMK